YAGIAVDNRSAAFFDLDRTLISGSSTFVFGIAAWRAGLVAKRQFMKDAAGALMFRYGGASDETSHSVRDRILGARFVTGDGVLARTGGRVVKNVAGHAAHRLLVGSRGALGVLLEASLKLLPHPPARCALLWGLDATTLADANRWRDWPRREPAALTVLGRTIAAKNPVLASDAPFAVIAGFEDDATWVAECATFARGALGPARVKVQDASVPPLWQQLADAEEMPGTRLTFTTSANTPDAIAFMRDRPVAERLVFHAACGRLHLWPAPEEAAALVSELAARGFALIDARGTALAATAADGPIAMLRKRLRAQLDPGEVFALGSRWGEQG
ncbi:MAG: hypothetical protein ABL977_10115, partial [Candidatus Eisenbacteria bacterium]